MEKWSSMYDGFPNVIKIKNEAVPENAEHNLFDS